MNHKDLVYLGKLIKNMKKILVILLVSILSIGCSENRVLIDELTNKGTKNSPLMYNEKGLFNGIGFDIHPNGQLKKEVNYKYGKKNGLHESWYTDGQISFQSFYKDNELDGRLILWWSNGQVGEYGYYKNGLKDGLHTK